MKTVLFACVHNAGRSQMAAALFNAQAEPAKARGVSAGTEPGPRVHPEVVAAMKELGIDLTSVQPRKLTDELASQTHTSRASAATTGPSKTRRESRSSGSARSGMTSGGGCGCWWRRKAGARPHDEAVCNGSLEGVR
jgi:hypothetical protein